MQCAWLLGYDSSCTCGAFAAALEDALACSAVLVSLCVHHITADTLMRAHTVCCCCRFCCCCCRVRIKCLEKLLILTPADATRLAAAEPALLTFRCVFVWTHATALGVQAIGLHALCIVACTHLEVCGCMPQLCVGVF
jgi:hypothetical protein